MTKPIRSIPKLRRWALLLGGLLGAGAAQGQVLNYSTATAANVAGTYTDLGTTGTAISTANTDDANSAAQNIGFTFSYNGASFTQFVLSTNGLIRLGSAAPSVTNLFANYETGQAPGVDPISSTSAADVNLIMPFNQDLGPGSAGNTEYRVATTGAAPNRVCTIQWKNVSDKSGTTTLSQYANFSFQVKLYETSNRVEFVYNTATASANTAIARYPTVGIKGSGAASGQTVLVNKASSSGAWSTSTFITGQYGTSTHNYRANVGPDAGRTYRFDVVTPPATCAGVTNATVVANGGTATTADATLTFTGATGAANYTLTLAQTGGTGTPATGTLSGSPISLTGLTPNTPYTVTIVTNCFGGGTSTPVTVTFTSGAAVSAPANDDCAGAIALTTGATCTPTNGTTIGATQTLAAIACGNFTGNADDDVWYRFVATATSHTVTVVGSATFDAVVDVRSGSCASSTNIGCADATLSGGTETATLSGLVVGQTYYVRVYSYGTTAGTFTICVTGGSAPATCAGVTNAAVTNTGGTATAVTASLTFTAATGATDYTLTLNETGSTAPPATGTLSGSPISLTGLTPNTSYTVTIVTNCSNGGTSAPVTVVFTSGAPVPAPANDNPTGATALTVSSTCTPTNGTNAGATTTTVNGYANPGTCGIAASPKDVWYSFTTLPGQTAATVTVTGVPAGLVRVFSAASNAGPFTQVNCSAGSANNTVAGPVSLTGLTANTTYYISVAGYGSNDTQGAFTICVTGTGTAPCVAPTALAAGSITTSGATLTFTPATGVSSYTVTYTAAGGTAQTQTATGSPVTLANLTSGTAYTVSVVTNCSATQTSVATTATFTTLTPCTAVTSLATSNVTTTSATLSFTGASAGTSYTVTYTAAGGTAQTQTATGSPVTLANLTPGTAYTVSVVTNCGSQVSPSASITFTTLAPCSAPTALTAGSITTTGATLTFTAPTAGATGYTVTYTAAGGTAQTQTATGSPVVLTGLTSGTAYTVSVVTNCGGGQTSAATSTTFTTLTPCTAVTGLTAGSITATGATLSFTGASAGTSYTVTYTAAGGTAQTQTATGSPVTLTGLQAGLQYSVSVVTNCGGGQTSTAATTTFTTTAPAPTNATVSNITGTGATIAFTAAAGATNYTVTYTRAGGTAQTQTVTGSPVTLTGLTSGAAYTVTIVANYPGGGTSSPVTVTFNTVLAARTALGGGELAVYPNPARQAFTVSLPALPAARTAQVELVNVLGQTISRQTVGLTAGGTRVPFDAMGLPTGVYSVRVQVNGETAVTRLVLE
ncbi:beta strand repeat-containing protein [Hymenobacter monticola]|uniref:Fibronectin type III domain-containing protein n=1 Tax=Hymenobacter monticola TaxID=1705399 RepID=A0ABY4B7T6_9BACT|nr:fibronectin type III domain-containing protein [Hymenobacter monticola]UOE34929.1 fibronectin type III domain-containing protein [Hymenobacter monticola]